jgi:hypothetical protein
MEILGGKTDYEGIFAMLNKNASAQSPVAPSSTNTGNEGRGVFDALKYYLSGSDEQISVFSAKGNLPGNVTPEGTKTASSLDGLSTMIEGFASRAAIIILGFIFVAVGLAMFKAPQSINIVSTAKKAI